MKASLQPKPMYCSRDYYYSSRFNQQYEKPTPIIEQPVISLASPMNGLFNIIFDVILLCQLSVLCLPWILIISKQSLPQCHQQITFSRWFSKWNYHTNSISSVSQKTLTVNMQGRIFPSVTDFFRGITLSPSLSPLLFKSQLNSYLQESRGLLSLISTFC